MTRSHWRLATGAGLLAAGLMANASVAVAVADSGTATGGADGAVASKPSTTHSAGPLGDIAKTLRDTIQGAANALNPGQLSSAQSTVGSTNASAVIAVPQMMADAIRVQAPITGFSAQPQNAQPQSSATPTADPAPPSPAAVTPVYGTAQNDVTHAMASLNTALAQTTNQVAQITNQVAQTANTTVVAPATAAVAAGVQSVVTPISAGLANVTAPIPDVLTSIQALLTSTADAVAPVTQLPSDLASLFGITGLQTAGAPVGAGANGSSATTLPTPLLTAGPLLLDHALTPAIIQDTAGAARATTVATATSAAASAMARASSLNATARTAPVDAMSEGLQEFFHSYGAIVIAASLSALAAAALPGLLALLVPTAAGVGVGYRQAKAGIALRGPGLARFAGSGPVGIVRTGSMVTLRPSALRVTRPARREIASRSHLAA